MRDDTILHQPEPEQPREESPQADKGVKIYFNPFQFTMEQNNAFLAAGYEVMPLRIPDIRGRE